MAKFVDVRKTGPKGLKGMKPITDPKMAGATPEEQERYRQVMAEKARLEKSFKQGYGDFSTTSRGYITPIKMDPNDPMATYGLSQYDEEGGLINGTPEHVQNTRWANQSNIDVIANSFAQFLGTGVTTIANGIAGIPHGIIDGSIRLAETGDIGSFIDGLTQNTTTTALQDASQAIKDAFHVYQNTQQQDSSFFSTENFTSGKMIADVANLAGFVSGAAVSGSAVSGLLKSFNVLGGANANISAVIAAMGEAAIEANHAIEEYVNPRKSQLAQEISAEYDIINSIEGISEEDKEAAYNKLVEKYDLGEKYIDATKNSVGRIAYGLNVAILTGSNIAQFGRIWRGNPHINQAKKAAQSRIDDLTKQLDEGIISKADYDAMVKKINEGVKSAAERMRDEAGRISLQGGTLMDEAARYQNEVSKPGMMGAFKNSLAEGTEEMSQAIASTTADNYGDWEMDMLYGKKYDDDFTEHGLSLLNGLVSSAGHHLTNEASWGEFFLGAIAGGIGAPISIDQDGKLTFFQGNAFTEYKMAKKEYTDAQQRVDALNEYISSDEFNRSFRHSVRDMAVEEAKLSAAQREDTEDFIRLEQAQRLQHLAFLASKGRLNDARVALESAQNLSEQDVQTIVDSVTERDENGVSKPSMYTDAAGNQRPIAEIRDEINKRNKEHLEDFGRYQHDLQELSEVFGHQFDYKTISDLAYLRGRVAQEHRAIRNHFVNENDLASLEAQKYFLNTLYGIKNEIINELKAKSEALGRGESFDDSKLDRLNKEQKNLERANEFFNKLISMAQDSSVTNSDFVEFLFSDNVEEGLSAEEAKKIKDKQVELEKRLAETGARYVAAFEELEALQKKISDKLSQAQLEALEKEIEAKEKEIINSNDEYQKIRDEIKEHSLDMDRVSSFNHLSNIGEFEHDFDNNLDRPARAMTETLGKAIENLNHAYNASKHFKNIVLNSIQRSVNPETPSVEQQVVEAKANEVKEKKTIAGVDGLRTALKEWRDDTSKELHSSVLKPLAINNKSNLPLLEAFYETISTDSSYKDRISEFGTESKIIPHINAFIQLYRDVLKKDVENGSYNGKVNTYFSKLIEELLEEYKDNGRHEDLDSSYWILRSKDINTYNTLVEDAVNRIIKLAKNEGLNTDPILNDYMINAFNEAVDLMSGVSPNSQGGSVVFNGGSAGQQNVLTQDAYNELLKEFDEAYPRISALLNRPNDTQALIDDIQKAIDGNGLGRILDDIKEHEGQSWFKDTDYDLRKKEAEKLMDIFRGIVDDWNNQQQQQKPPTPSAGFGSSNGEVAGHTTTLVEFLESRENDWANGKSDDTTLALRGEAVELIKGSLTTPSGFRAVNTGAIKEGTIIKYGYGKDVTDHNGSPVIVLYTEDSNGNNRVYLDILKKEHAPELYADLKAKVDDLQTDEVQTVTDTSGKELWSIVQDVSSNHYSLMKRDNAYGRTFIKEEWEEAKKNGTKVEVFDSTPSQSGLQKNVPHIVLRNSSGKVFHVPAHYLRVQEAIKDDQNHVELRQRLDKAIDEYMDVLKERKTGTIADTLGKVAFIPSNIKFVLREADGKPILYINTTSISSVNGSESSANLITHSVIDLSEEAEAKGKILEALANLDIPFQFNQNEEHLSIVTDLALLHTHGARLKISRSMPVDKNDPADIQRVTEELKGEAFEEFKKPAEAANKTTEEFSIEIDGESYRVKRNRRYLEVSSNGQRASSDINIIGTIVSALRDHRASNVRGVVEVQHYNNGSHVMVTYSNMGSSMTIMVEDFVNDPKVKIVSGNLFMAKVSFGSEVPFTQEQQDALNGLSEFEQGVEGQEFIVNGKKLIYQETKDANYIFHDENGNEVKVARASVEANNLATGGNSQVSIDPKLAKFVVGNHYDEVVKDLARKIFSGENKPDDIEPHDFFLHSSSEVFAALKAQGYELFDKELLLVSESEKDVYIGGRPDLIFYNKDTGHVMIVDIKTSKNDLSKNDGSLISNPNYSKTNPNLYSKQSQAWAHAYQLNVYADALAAATGIDRTQIDTYTMMGGIHYQVEANDSINSIADAKIKFSAPKVDSTGYGAAIGVELKYLVKVSLGNEASQSGPVNKDEGLSEKTRSRPLRKPVAPKKNKLAEGNTASAKPIDHERELAWMRRALPNVSQDIVVAIYSGLLTTMERGVHAWGELDGSIMSISEKAARGTLFHEAFHAVFNYILSEQDRAVLFEELRQSGHQHLAEGQLEEIMADSFAEYMVLEEYGNIFSRTTRKWWKGLRGLVIGYKSKRPRLEKLFGQINRGALGQIPLSVAEYYEDTQHMSLANKILRDYIASGSTMVTIVNGATRLTRSNDRPPVPMDISEVVEKNRHVLDASRLNIANSLEEYDEELHHGYMNGESMVLNLNGYDNIDVVPALESNMDISSLLTNEQVRRLEGMGMTLSEYKSLPTSIQENIRHCRL